MGCTNCRGKTGRQDQLISNDITNLPLPPPTSQPLPPQPTPSRNSIAKDGQPAQMPQADANQPPQKPRPTTSSLSIQTSKSLIQNYLKDVYSKAEKENQDKTLKAEPTPEKIQSLSSKRMDSSAIRFRRESFVQMLNDNVNKRYAFQTKLGEGAFGCVFKCTDKTTQQQRAIKVIKKRALKNSDNFFAQLQILRILDHPNIIKLYEVYDYKDFYYVTTQYCSGGELFEVVRKSQKITQKNVAYMMKQILSAVYYMHQRNLMHRDLKPENIVLEYKATKDALKDPPIKIIDFGMAVKYKPGKFLSEKTGSPYYVAPEVLDCHYNEKCDLWSCGVILYTLLCGSPPFRGQSIPQIFQNIKKASPSFQQRIWPRISSGARDLVKCLLQKNPTKRISAQQALAHVWIQQCQNAEAIDSGVLQNLQVFYFKNKFLAIVETYLATNAVSQEDRRMLAEKFKEIDKDNSGSIEVAELVSAFKIIYGEKYTEEAINQIVANIDSNGSGKIDFTEFIVAIQAKEKLFQKTSLENAFDFFDKDKTGFLEIAELKALLGNSSEQEVQQLLQTLDENHDQKISKQEFVNRFQNE